MARITFTDGAGTAVLRPRAPDTPNGTLAARLRDWTPATGVVGDRATALADGSLHVFRFRTDYRARFTLPGISAHWDAVTASFPLEVADRLVAHLEAGGTATLATEDATGATYVVGLAPGARAELRPTDPRALEYELALDVIRRDGVAAPLVCRYGRTS